MAVEIQNLVHCMATIAVQGSGQSNLGLCGAAGVAELVYDDVGEYTLIPVALFDNKVPLSPSDPPLPNYRNIVVVNDLQPVFPGSGQARALFVPNNVPSGPGSIPGTLKIFLSDEAGTPVDSGFFQVMVFDLPTQV